jgi:large subunit ribosomal protein L5
MNDLTKLNSDKIEKLKKELSIDSSIGVPKIEKIVVNAGIKDALSDKKNIDNALSILTQITGQKPKITTARKSIATFKLREGDKIGAMVTLRGKRMYDFYDKLVGIVFPRLRDFRGISVKKFDGRGNYSIGFQETMVFPEIDPAKQEKNQSLEVSIVTTAKNDKEGEALLRVLGMPFAK